MSKILVIDDDSEIRYSLKRVLDARGYQVILAGSGEEGIEVAGRLVFKFAPQSELQIVV